MSGSAVVTLEQRVPPVLKVKRPLLLGQGGRLAAHEEDGGRENALVAAERAWFAKRLREGLTRTRGVLRAIKNDALDGDDDDFERLAQLMSVRAVMEALAGLPGEVFRSWFSDNEWLGQYRQRKPRAATYTEAEKAKALVGRLLRMRH